MIHDSTLVERFWAKVKVGAPNECWPWQGGRKSKGYGVLTIPKSGGKTVLAHRLSYAIATEGSEQFPKLYVCHRCDNPPCVNPAHLFTGTAEDNTRDAIKKGRMIPYIRPKDWIRPAPLEWRDVLLIRRLHKNGKTNKKIAAKFGFTVSRIESITSRRCFAFPPCR